MTYSEYEYEVGQEIYHAVYGYGVILSKTDIGQGVYRYEVGFQRYPGQVIDVVGNVQIMPVEKEDQDESDAESLGRVINMLFGDSKKKKNSKEKDDSMAMNERKISLDNNGNVTGGAIFGGPTPAFGTVSTSRKSEPDSVARHRKIVMGLNELYAKKNADYGDSFHETFKEEGMAMARIRLSDKLNRFKSLTRGKSQQVNDESVRDTLLDLANYAIMTVIELDREAENV